uniref:Uncharacterized protein n=1 Tax=Strongyloides venezuelensis TaxID=75913 RepID=A0A0K0FR42_STRVS
MKILHLSIGFVLIELTTQFWWGCCGGCSGCGLGYQPIINYMNVPIYERVPAPQINPIPEPAPEPVVILHRKTIIKEIPTEDESEEEEPRYIMRARKPKRVFYRGDDNEDRYVPEKPVEKIVYVQQPPPNFNVYPSQAQQPMSYNMYTTPQTPMYMPQGGSINVGQSEIPYQPQQVSSQTTYQQPPSQSTYQQNPPQSTYQQIPPQSTFQQPYQNPQQTIVQPSNQQPYKRRI